MGETVEITQNITYEADTTKLDEVAVKLERLNELLNETKSILTDIGTIGISIKID